MGRRPMPLARFPPNAQLDRRFAQGGKRSGTLLVEARFAFRRRTRSSFRTPPEDNHRRRDPPGARESNDGSATLLLLVVPPVLSVYPCGLRKIKALTSCGVSA